MKNYLNGYDLSVHFGIEITNATNQFMQFPERKASISNNFQDKDGTDIDLATPKFEARTFLFNCVITAESIALFKQQYFKFFQLLKQGDTYQLYNDFVDMTLYLFFQKEAQLSNMQRTQGDKFAMTFQLQFGETNPFDNLPIVVLVSDTDAVLIP